MGRRRRCSALPPLPPHLLLILLSLAAPSVDAVTPRPVRGTLVQRLVGQAERNQQSGRHGGVSGHRQEIAAGVRRLMKLGMEDEEDDSDEGSGSPLTPLPHVTALTPSATHRLRHDRGHSGDQRDDRRPQEMTAPSTQLLPAVRLSTPQPASQNPTSFGIPRPAPPPPPPPPSPPRRHLRAHDACYSSNEVLLVVGVTCAVNFAFILVVVALVHLCNRGAAKVVPAAFEYEPQADGDCRTRAAAGVGCIGVASAVGTVDLTGAGGVAAAYTRVQEYVDSLPDALSPFHREDEDEGAVGEEMVVRCGGEGGGDEDVMRTGGRAPRRRSAHGLHTAFSMEQLLFVD